MEPTGILTPYRPARSLVATSIRLSRRVRNLFKQNEQNWINVRVFGVNTLPKYLTVSLR